MRTADLAGENEYAAVAYIWGEQKRNHTIECDGAMIMVTKRCADVLRTLRNKDYEQEVWIDQLCIHQGDKKEKEEQVLMMFEIYSSARVVLVWLRGELEQKVSEICQSHQEVQEQDESGDIVPKYITTLEIEPQGPGGPRIILNFSGQHPRNSLLGSLRSIMQALAQGVQHRKQSQDLQFVSSTQYAHS